MHLLFNMNKLLNQDVFLSFSLPPRIGHFREYLVRRVYKEKFADGVTCDMTNTNHICLTILIHQINNLTRDFRFEQTCDGLRHFCEACDGIGLVQTKNSNTAKLLCHCIL